jgi:hypothetical protein
MIDYINFETLFKLNVFKAYSRHISRFVKKFYNKSKKIETLPTVEDQEENKRSNLFWNLMSPQHRTQALHQILQRIYVD